MRDPRYDILFEPIKNYNNKSDIQIGGDFELTNHLGQKVTNKSFNEYYRLVFFGFTNCPDFCPNTLNNIGIVFLILVYCFLLFIETIPIKKIMD